VVNPIATDPTAFFDEAGIHSESEIIVVGGYLASAGGLYKGWSRKDADELTDRIVPIAARFKGQAYGVHITAATWYAAVPFVKDFLPENPHSAPYLILAKRAIQTILDLRKSYQKQRIGFVFARNDWRQLLLDGYDVVKTEHPRNSLMGPIAVDDAKDNPMLQAADLFAWHYRHITEMRKGIIKPSLHRATRHLFNRRRDNVLRYISEKTFNAEIAAMFEKHGAEWNETVLLEMIHDEERRREKAERGKKWRGDTR
jgi:hypothetical protein